jgi:hypothetical protein
MLSPDTRDGPGTQMSIGRETPALTAIRDRQSLHVCENGDAAKVARDWLKQRGRASVRRRSGFMTYRAELLSPGNVDMDHGCYIYS